MEKTSSKVYQAVGKRKSAIARVSVTPGDGHFFVNGHNTLESYFGRPALSLNIKRPLEVTGSLDQVNVVANIIGGGPAGQADALKSGIAKALLALNADFRKSLRTAGFLTRDSRVKERKHYGKRGARRGNQWTKR